MLKDLKPVGDWFVASVLVASVVAMAFAVYWRELFPHREPEVVLICSLLLAGCFVRRCWNERSSARRDAWSVASWVGLVSCAAAFVVAGSQAGITLWVLACFGLPAFMLGVSLVCRDHRLLSSTMCRPIK